MQSPVIQQEGNLKVLAIPQETNNNNIKLISANQYHNSLPNGYEQFEIQLGEQTALKSIEEINNVINLKYVTVLSLRNCGLQYLPKEVMILPLRELDVMQNSLSHVPDCLYFGLPNIEVLNLSYNPIKDFNLVPKCVHDLRQLNVEGCKLLNVPAWIWEMKAEHLEALYYSHNKTELKSKESLQLPVQLRKAVFINTNLQQHMVAFFQNINLLQYLDLSNTAKKNLNWINNVNQLAENMLWYRHIRFLKLCNLGINELSENFSKMVNLQELHLKQNLLLTLPAGICSLRCLVVLDISCNCIYSLPDLVGLEKLEELHAANNHLGCLALGHMAHLRYVDLYNNELSSLEIAMVQTIECIDVEQNWADASVLFDIDNYEARRECLRARISAAAGKDGSLQTRVSGRKLAIFEETVTDSAPPSDSSDRYDLECDEDDRSGATSDEGLGDSQSSQCGNTKPDEDAECDWGEVGTPDLVTLSDAEFFPDDVQIPFVVGRCINNIDTSLDYLFIDAD